MNRLAATNEYQSPRHARCPALWPQARLGGLETTCLHHLGSGLDRLDGRAGDGVGRERLVEVEEDTRVGRGVEGGEVATTADGLAATASDLEVDALGVGLSTVGLASRVKTNDLVSENVVSGLEVLGDGELP